MSDKKEKTAISSFAHDIKTPLSVIRAYLSCQNLTDEEMRELHEAASNSLAKIFRMIETLLKTERKGKPLLDKRDVAGALKAAVDAVRPFAAERGVNIRYVGPETQHVVVDEAVVDRVVSNLVTNAIQASPASGDVRVELFANDAEMFIEVVDAGCGIDESHFERIFERGFTHGKADGTGIGLDVCREIVGSHRGSIRLASRKGVGTAFTVSIPQDAKTYGDETQNSAARSSFPANHDITLD